MQLNPGSPCHLRLLSDRGPHVHSCPHTCYHMPSSNHHVRQQNIKCPARQNWKKKKKKVPHFTHFFSIPLFFYAPMKTHAFPDLKLPQAKKRSETSRLTQCPQCAGFPSHSLLIERWREEPHIEYLGSGQKNINAWVSDSNKQLYMHGMCKSVWQVFQPATCHILQFPSATFVPLCQCGLFVSSFCCHDNLGRIPSYPTLLCSLFNRCTQNFRSHVASQ